jgi:hypothetical protein
MVQDGTAVERSHDEVQREKRAVALSQRVMGDHSRADATQIAWSTVRR